MRNKTSLFLGRWQPWHKGHQTLVETTLKEGNNVIIAMRETPISEKDPYTTEERKGFIQKAMKEWGDKVQIISIPDFDEVCYGRKVGWSIREIKLDSEIESISATKIRENK